MRGAAALLLAASLACGPARAGPPQAEVFALIGERLALMKPVADWKYRNGKSVEDTAREAVVLDKAVASASAAGLDPASVRPFFRAQIEAAKAIQRCWIGRWNAGAPLPAGAPPDLAANIRPQLIDLGARLTAALAGALAAGVGFNGAAAPDFAAAVTTDCLGREPRGAVYAALTGVRRAAAAGQ